LEIIRTSIQFYIRHYIYTCFNTMFSTNHHHCNKTCGSRDSDSLRNKGSSGVFHQHIFSTGMLIPHCVSASSLHTFFLSFFWFGQAGAWIGSAATLPHHPCSQALPSPEKAGLGYRVQD
jgi:hypothetical protein